MANDLAVSMGGAGGYLERTSKSRCGCIHNLMKSDNLIAEDAGVFDMFDRRTGADRAQIAPFSLKVSLARWNGAVPGDVDMTRAGRSCAYARRAQPLRAGT